MRKYNFFVWVLMILLAGVVSCVKDADIPVDTVFHTAHTWDNDTVPSDTLPSAPTPEVTLNGLFSVSSTQQVYFSQGNLQYQASTNTWQFAANQYDIIGEANSNISSSYDGWIDLFGWGTSGYNDKSPYMTSSNDYDYGNGENDIAGTNYDWGVYNAISNGGNQAGLWRTLTKEEWVYVFNTRTTTSGIRFAMACVNDVKGVILLPDEWDTNTYSLNNTNSFVDSFTTNIITATQWTTLEEAGAVFLPVAGYRDGTSVLDVGIGYYWSATCGGSNGAYTVLFRDMFLCLNICYSRNNGQSVRLVRSEMFNPPSVFTIEVLANPSDGGSVSGGGNYEYGQNCTVSATANSGYTFTNWTENDSVVSTNADYTFVVNADRTLVANFVAVLSWPNGVLPEAFSVSSTQQVNFSQGNLQYQASTNIWRFAANQYDVIGGANGNISSSYSGWIDLFGWGTSGWNSGANCYEPWSTSTEYTDYYPGGSYTNNLTGSCADADWGVYNKISNGGNQEGLWRALTKDEWVYVLNTRTTSSGIRYAKACVNNVNGVILLPDNWSSGYYALSDTNSGDASFSTNAISASEWVTLEQYGAVFLPAAGCRDGTSVSDVGSGGSYWSTSYYNSKCAHRMVFLSGVLGNNYFYRSFGFSVRLVRSETSNPPLVFTIEVSANPSDGGSVSGGGDYEEGQSCTVHASAKTGYTFTNWTENGSVVSTNANYTFAVNADRILVANFTEKSYTISVSANPSNGGSVSGGGNYNYGQNCTVSASANSDFTFINWTENGSVVSTNADYTFNVNANRTLVANFMEIPQGAISGLFSVSSTQQVFFSKGNLQYIGSASVPYWKFAENQWDYLGIKTGQNSGAHDVDRDLFGWGTSGYNGQWPYRISNESISYGDGDNDIAGTNYDWGVYNAISNGGNTANTWRTLTKDEWEYVLNTRTTSSGIRYAKGSVNHVLGVILLPDDWSNNYYSLNDTNNSDASFSANVVLVSQWTTLEQYGAVFLPAAGYRGDEASVADVNTRGYYWWASAYTTRNAYRMFFDDLILRSYVSVSRFYGQSVRLVHDAQ